MSQIVNTPLGSVEATHTKVDLCNQKCFFCYYDYHELCVNKDCDCIVKEVSNK